MFAVDMVMMRIAQSLADARELSARTASSIDEGAETMARPAATTRAAPASVAPCQRITVDVAVCVATAVARPIRIGGSEAYAAIVRPRSRSACAARPSIDRTTDARRRAASAVLAKAAPDARLQSTLRATEARAIERP